MRRTPQNIGNIYQWLVAFVSYLLFLPFQHLQPHWKGADWELVADICIYAAVGIIWLGIFASCFLIGLGAALLGGWLS